MESLTQHTGKILSKPIIRPHYIAAKRVFDVCVAFLTIVGLSPVFILISFLICATSKGPVIFCHKRVGLNGKEFLMYKFRTMVDGAEKLRSCFTKEQENEFKENYKLKEDPRVTPAGRILRKTSLDELPQFFNVLKGEMSIVGPRPVTHEELAKFKEHAEDIISAYPGITGLWQISGRSEVLFIDRVAMDMQYIQNRSFLMDIKIFLKTVYVVIMQRGAF